MGATFNASADNMIRTSGVGCPSSTLFSACGWARRTGGGSGLQAICDIDNGGSRVFIGFNGTDLAVCQQGTYTAFASSPSVNQWFFWALTSANTGAGNLKGYWAAIGATAFITQTNTGVAVSTPRILLGNNAWSNYYTGELAYVKVWDAELSSAELWQEMMQGLPVRYADINCVTPLWTAADAVKNYAIPANVWTVNGTLDNADMPPVSYHVQTYSLYIEELVSSTGTLSATLGAASVVATGKAAVKGVLAKTLDSASLSAAGKVTIDGVLSATLANAALSATGTVTVEGVLTNTLGAATLSATGTAQVQGQLSATLADAAVTATGAVSVDGQLSQTLAAATVTGTGTVTVSGQLSQTLQDAAVTGTGTVRAEGALTQTLAACTLAATGTTTSADVIGTLAQTLADATITATGEVAVSGSAAITLADCGVVSTGTVSVSGALGQTLEDASLSATGVVAAGRIGTLNVTLADASLTATGYQFWFGSVTVSDILRDQVGMAIALLDDSSMGDQTTDGVGMGHALIDDVTMTEVEV